MKLRTLLFAAIAGPASFCFCQDPAPAAGFLNVVNLVTLRQPTRIELGGFQFNGGEPVPAGESSGIIAIVPGTHTFSISNPAAKPDSVSGPLTIEDGKTVAVICYDEVKEYKDGSRESKLRFNVLIESNASKGPRLSLVSLMKQPAVAVNVSGEPMTLQARQARQAAVKRGDSVKVVHEGRTLAEIDIAKPIHYIGFLFEDPESGDMELSLIQNEKLEYQPPLEKDWEEKEKEPE